MTTDKQMHTEELWAVDRHGFNVIRADGSATIAMTQPSANMKDHARLITAACNSYRTHCGPRAVECAEGDLLGELLEALKGLHGVADRLCSAIERAEQDIGGETPEQVLKELGPETDKARAAIAKAQP